MWDFFWLNVVGMGRDGNDVAKCRTLALFGSHTKFSISISAEVCYNGAY